jgi:hypothetical protein
LRNKGNKTNGLNKVTNPYADNAIGIRCNKNKWRKNLNCLVQNQ